MHVPSEILSYQINKQLRIVLLRTANAALNSIRVSLHKDKTKTELKQN